MVRKLKVNRVTKEILDHLGFSWHTNIHHVEKDYVSDELVVLGQEEADRYYEAADELYGMLSRGVEHVIEKGLFGEIGIPDNLVEAAKLTWEEENEKHWHLYGRFDFAGGVDGLPIKLIEFNADTPTSLLEIGVIQWLLLKYNGLDERRQFNEVWEKIRENFERLQEKNPDLLNGNFRRAPQVLFSSYNGFIEDENTTRILQAIALEAMCVTDFEFVDRVIFAEEGIFKQISERGSDRCDYWFKLVPWEEIALREPEMMEIITRLLREDKAVILNPPWTVLMQSKGMMKILWDLFPNHPLLLETSFSPLRHRRHVEKPLFGREGDNVKIVDDKGAVVFATEGQYNRFRPVYQEYADFPEDGEGYRYQSGVFVSYEPCGLGFRRDKGIVRNESPFVGHMIDG